MIQPYGIYGEPYNITPYLRPQNFCHITLSIGCWLHLSQLAVFAFLVHQFFLQTFQFCEEALSVQVGSSSSSYN